MFPDNFLFALSILWPEEGGYSNRTTDHGGPTMMGVTQRIFDVWRDKIKQPRADVRTITTAEASNLYYDLFWLPAHCDDMPKRIGCAQFDTAVNSGEHEAILILQRALGVPDTGVYGPTTRNALSFADSSFEDDALRRYTTARGDFMALLAAQDPTQQANLNGWKNRINNLLNKLLSAEAA